MGKNDMGESGRKGRSQDSKEGYRCMDERGEVEKKKEKEKKNRKRSGERRGGIKEYQKKIKIGRGGKI